MAANSRRDKIKLGAFIALVIAAGLGVLIFFVGVSLGEDTKEYTIFFTQSITGLTPGSQVTLNGVRVGEVRGIAVDSENVEQVIVEISVLAPTPVKVDTRAVLSSQGITGLKYVNLEESTHEAKLLDAGSTIPTSKGLVDRLTDRADDVTASTDAIIKQVAKITRDENIEKIDQLVIQSVELVSNANTLTRELSKTMIVTRELLERNETQIDRTIKNVSVASGQLDGVLREARGAIATGRLKLEEADIAALMAGLDQTNMVLRGKLGEIDVSSLVQTLATLQVLVLELTKSIGQNQDQLRAVMLNMRLTTDNLKDLSRSVKDQPSSLIFEKSPKEREVPDAK